jgi:cysteine-rich repeat protein
MIAEAGETCDDGNDVDGDGCSRACQAECGVPCPNACSLHGQCSDGNCLCDVGWRGVDCSIPTCYDVLNCSRRGTCVAPNECACSGQWGGRACTVSQCIVARSCRECASVSASVAAENRSADRNAAQRIGCGWCDELQSCWPGDLESMQFRDMTCPTWFYGTCMTVVPSASTPSTCSPRIKRLPCDSICRRAGEFSPDCFTCKQVRLSAPGP